MVRTAEKFCSAAKTAATQNVTLIFNFLITDKLDEI